MIFTDRTIMVQKGTSSINDTIVLYRGDKDVEIRFTLNEGSPFRFSSGSSSNIIEKTEAAYGQLIIRTPNDLPSIFSEVSPTNEGKIIFTITAEMIDEITEVGDYSFQIRLFDESMTSRVTLPEVNNGIEIREPIASEGVSTTNEVNVATVGYALTTAGTTEDAFDSQGNYNKTTWQTGDRITAAKLDKIEAGIDGVNKKVASGGSNINDTTASATTTYSSNKIETIIGQKDAELIDARIGANGVTYNNLGTAIRKQINAITSDVSSSNTLTIDDSFTGKVISVDITGFKGQVVEFIISCDNSVLADNYGIQIGVTKPDGTSINAIWTVTPNKTFRLKLDYNIKKINAWIGSKLGNGDVVLTASIKNIFDYTYELDNKTDELNNKTENIKRFLCDNDFPNVYKVSNSVTIDAIKSFLVTVQGTFKKDEKINIRVDSDCINSNADIMIAIKYPTETKTDVARVKSNSSVEFIPTENATQISIWVDKSHLNSTGTVTLSVKNFIALKDKVDELDNKISKLKPLQRLSFSVLGDSYSTYKGWIPQGNASWYADEGNSTPENDVAGVVDTWWHKLSKDTGMSLLINDSYSGSTVSTSGYNGDDYTSICFTTRMVNTLGEKRTLEPKPNIIFIFGGTNDNWTGGPIGELKYSDWSTEDLKSFLPAFCYMIAYIKKYNPQARIINIINTDLKSEITNGMVSACEHYGIENIVLRNIGKTGSHPNKEGMEAIKNQIISIL